MTFICFIKFNKALYKAGNTIGNIRNYGYMAENGGWIYFVAPDENGEKMCIYKTQKNGKNKEIILGEEWDILGLNVYKNKIYFNDCINGLKKRIFYFLLLLKNI